MKNWQPSYVGGRPISEVTKSPSKYKRADVKTRRNSLVERDRIVFFLFCLSGYQYRNDNNAYLQFDTGSCKILTTIAGHLQRWVLMVPAHILKTRLPCSLWRHLKSCLCA